MFKKVEQLEKSIYDMGVCKLGFADVQKVLPENLKDLRYAVSFAVRLLDRVINEIDKAPTYTYYHHYKTVNNKIDLIGLEIAELLQESGYMALPIPASQSIPGTNYEGLFSHKTAAYLAGLGYVGKSALFITPEYGPRIRLGTVLTDMPLPVNKHFYFSQCGDCNICVKKCPALAIKGNQWAPGIERDKLVDARACSRFMKSQYSHIGRGFVCGICIKYCPKGERVIR